MGKEQVRPAVGAAAYDADCFRFQPRSEQLAAVGFRQVQVQAGTDGRMARRTLGEKQHRVLCPHRVGVVDLAEQFPAIRELRLEARQHLFADSVAACPDPRTDSGNQVLRP